MFRTLLALLRTLLVLFLTLLRQKLNWVWDAASNYWRYSKSFSKGSGTLPKPTSSIPDHFQKVLEHCQNRPPLRENKRFQCGCWLWWLRKNPSFWNFSFDLVLHVSGKIGVSLMGRGVQRIGFSADGLPGHLMCVLICGFIYPCQKDILKFRLKKGIFHLKPQPATKIQAKPRPQMFRNRKLRWKLHFKSYQNRKPHLEPDCKEAQTATCKHTPPPLMIWWGDLGDLWNGALRIGKSYTD